MASAASLAHAGSPTHIVRQESKIRRGPESVRTNELNAAGDHGRPNHTTVRKHEAGNDDLSHVMPEGANFSSLPRKKKLTLYAASNT